MEKTVQHSSFRNKETDEVRHLLIDEVNGRANVDLVLFTAEGEEKIFSGTEYEARQKADELGHAWVKDEGFKRAKPDEPPYEPLESAVRLAMRLGHDAIYDPRLVQMDVRKPRFNAAGLIRLKEWTGMQAKNGGTYRYAVKMLQIAAEPQLPPGYVLSGADFPQQMLNAMAAKKSIGPSAEFLFASLTVV